MTLEKPSRPSFLLIAVCSAVLASAGGYSYSTFSRSVIGGTAVIKEVTTGVEFTARVDTGAAVSSIHVEPKDVVIVDESPQPTENIDKTVRLKIDNGEGEKAWIETQIEDYVEVRNAETAEHRYRVRLPLQCGDVLKFAVVNLNDRSNMTYKLLLGRDFLRNDFLVDVTN